MFTKWLGISSLFLWAEIKIEIIGGLKMKKFLIGVGVVAIVLAIAFIIIKKRLPKPEELFV